MNDKLPCENDTDRCIADIGAEAQRKPYLPPVLVHIPISLSTAGKPFVVPGETDVTTGS